MLINEILDDGFKQTFPGLSQKQLAELSYLGSPCTKDCSGHRAGYKWYQRKRRTPQSASASFNKGAALAQAGK